MSRTTLLAPAAMMVAATCLQIAISGPQSPPFSGRVRPVDQLTVDSTQSLKKKDSPKGRDNDYRRALENSFMPIMSSGFIATKGYQNLTAEDRIDEEYDQKTAKKNQSSESIDNRKEGAARKVAPASSSANVFQFPNEANKSPVTPAVGMAKTYHFPPHSKKKNASSRFFSFNTERQTLDLGVSFTIPFISIPMTSLVNIGETTSSALTSLWDINWPSALAVGTAVLAASLLLPLLVQWLSSFFLYKNTLATNYINSLPMGYSIPDSAYGFRGGHYSRSFEVSPLASLLEQLDDALSEYDLDATSCMQRAVCTTVADSEHSVSRGDTDSAQLIITGLARSKWIPMIFGQNTFTKAIEVGRSGGSCKKQYTKCPFSLGGVLRFLTSYASFL